jgi:hypothetical protein
MSTYVVALIAVIALVGGGYYSWQAYGGAGASESPMPDTEKPVMSTYATSTFSISYPASFSLDDAYVNDTVVPTKPISGVKFSVSAAIVEGTNLSADSGVSVEWLPRAKQCTGDIYLADAVKSFTLAVGSTTYSVATSTGVAAGNLYEEQVYAVEGSAPCTAVHYFLHSTNIGNYPEGAVREFDRAGLRAAFDAIRDSLVLSR